MSETSVRVGPDGAGQTQPSPEFLRALVRCYELILEHVPDEPSAVPSENGEGQREPVDGE